MNTSKFKDKQFLIAAFTLVVLIILFIVKFDNYEVRNMIIILALIDHGFILKKMLSISEQSLTIYICTIIVIGAMCIAVL